MLKSRTTVKATRLLRDRTGNVSMIFALVAIPVLGMLGLAIDFGRETHIKDRMQAVLDAAVLSVVMDQSGSANPNETASQNLQAEFQREGFSPMVSIVADRNAGTVSATASVRMNTLFMGLLSQSSVVVEAKSSAITGAGGPMDVAIAFDTTGSMAGSKMSAAQTAAGDLVDLLYKLPGTSAPNPAMRVGLVPFTYYVNVGLGNRNASWMSVPQDSTSSYNDCPNSWPQLTTPVHYTQTCSADGTPYDCSYDDWNDYNQTPTSTCTTVTDTHQWHGCAGSQASPADAGVAATAANPVPGLIDTWCAAELIRLSNDPVTVKTAITGMAPGGETYIAPGLLWGWRVLSDDGSSPFRDGGPKATHRKRLILMTDGANTHSANYPDHEGSDVVAANLKTKQVCDNIKADGVQIYSIVFDVTDPTIKQLLADCSSGPPFYYDANTTAEMENAFKKIGHELTMTHLTK